MRLLLTGASGFVGQHLAPYLQKSAFKVLPFSLRNDWQPHVPERYDAVIHLAGKAHDTKNTDAAEAYYAVNTGLTCALFDIFLQSRARDFIYFSSVKAAADTVKGVLTETHVPDPQTPYGRSKLEAERYLLSCRLPEGKRLLILRPCMIHGPGNKGNLNLLYKFVAKGVPYPLAAFENKRSFLSIENLCFLIKSLLDTPDAPSGIYHMADDGAVSTNDLVRIIARALHRKPMLLPVPKGILKSIAAAGDLLKLPLNSERLKKLTENYVVSNEKIKDVLHLPHLPLTAEEGLFKTIQSFR